MFHNFYSLSNCSDMSVMVPQFTSTSTDNPTVPGEILHNVPVMQGTFSHHDAFMAEYDLGSDG